MHALEKKWHIAKLIPKKFLQQTQQPPKDPMLELIHTEQPLNQTCYNSMAFLYLHLGFQWTQKFTLIGSCSRENVITAENSWPYFA